MCYSSIGRSGGRLEGMEDIIPLNRKPDIGRLLKICEGWGYRDVPELVDRYLFKDTCPAICLECGSIVEKDADQRAGWCCHCDDDTMVSALVLAGLL
jgi:hypothetical protein